VPALCLKRKLPDIHHLCTSQDRMDIFASGRLRLPPVSCQVALCCPSFSSITVSAFCPVRWNLLANFSRHMLSIFREEPAKKLRTLFPKNWVELSAILARPSGTLVQGCGGTCWNWRSLWRGSEKQEPGAANAPQGAALGILMVVRSATRRCFGQPGGDGKKLPEAVFPDRQASGSPSAVELFFAG
jgi:hypothetical protein